MEEIRQIYQTISDYLTNPTFLNALAGTLTVGGLVCFGYSAKLMKDMRNLGKREENNGLEEKF